MSACRVTRVAPTLGCMREPRPPGMRAPRVSTEPGCPDLGIPACDVCPLDICRYDMPGGSKTARALARKADLLPLYQAGATNNEVAAAGQVSRRTAIRYRVELRAAGLLPLAVDHRRAAVR